MYCLLYRERQMEWPQMKKWTIPRRKYIVHWFHMRRIQSCHLSPTSLSHFHPENDVRNYHRCIHYQTSHRSANQVSCRFRNCHYISTQCYLQRKEDKSMKDCNYSLDPIQQKLKYVLMTDLGPSTIFTAELSSIRFVTAKIEGSSILSDSSSDNKPSLSSARFFPS